MVFVNSKTKFYLNFQHTYRISTRTKYNIAITSTNNVI